MLIDAGPDIYAQLRRWSAGRAGEPGGAFGHEQGHGHARRPDPAAVFLTHVHPDHFHGLADLPAALQRAAPLYVLDDNRRPLEDAFGWMLRRGLEVRTMRFGEPVVAAGLRLTPFDTHHFPEFATAGLLVEPEAGGGPRIAYAPDFLRTGHDLSGLDLLLLDGSSLDRDAFGHLSIRGGIELGRRTAARRTVFTHIGHVKQPHSWLEGFARREGGADFGIAHDGLAIDV